MTRELKQSLLVTGLIVVTVTLDQALKLYIRTHFALGESVEVTSWFWITFVENEGMAFGIKWFSKLLLTLFRIAAVGVLGWYIHRLIYINKVRGSFLTLVSLVTSGAIGNIIDCVCYGKLFGYAGWFYGRVVDMLYFPLITNSAGECIFFRPVVNLADSYITVSVIVLFLFFRKDIDKSLQKKCEPSK